MSEMIAGLRWLLLAVFVVCMSIDVQAQSTDTVLRVGVVDAPSPHYRFSFESGEATGFAIETWAQIAKLSGISYRIVYFDNLKALTRAAKSDLVDVAPLLEVNDKNAAVFDFSDSVHRSRMMVFKRKNNTIVTSDKTLAGRRVSFVDGGMGKALIRSYRGVLGINQENVEEALNSLISSTSDALVHQEEVLWEYARQQGVASLLTTVGSPLASFDLAVGLRKGQFPALLKQINASLEAHLASAAFYNAREEWGGNPKPWIDPIRVARVLVGLLAASLIALVTWRYFSVVQLNTALSRSVMERKAAEDRFRDLAESASDWFFEQDKDLKLTFLSPRFESVTGISPKKLLGQKRWEIDGGIPAGEEEVWEKHQKVVEAHEDWQDFTYSVTTEDGERRTLRTSGKAVFDDAGRFAGYRGVGRDITLRLNLEDSLQQSRKMEMVGQLTGGIAHDFNNLLTVMTGNLELLKGRVSEDDKSARYVATATEAADLGSRLTRQLLAFSRRQTLMPKHVDLNELVRGMMGLVNSSLGRSIRVRTALGSGRRNIFADSAQLQNAILNLVINARDAMPDGGELEIATRDVTLNNTFVEKHPVARTGDFVVLEVSDDGAGISEDQLSKVIEPFYTTKDVGKGAGLGLSMVYGLAQQSEGFMLIDSVVGEGTCVRIYLPVSEREGVVTETAELRAPEATERAAGETVLVVEDDAQVREITTIRLEEIGYQVLEAKDAEDALSALQSGSNIDVVFTDILMPGKMSGIDLAGRVRKDWPDIRILFSTGYSKQAPTLGDDGELGPCLLKPYRHDELARKMREVLDA